MKKYILFLIVTSITLVSCKKDKSDLYTQAASDAALAEQLTIDVLREILSKGPDYVADKSYSGADGLIVTSDPLIESDVFPKEITFNYGTGITGPLGATRKGNLVFTIPSGTVRTVDIGVSFDGFSINGSEILGSITYNYSADQNGYNGDYGTDGISIINNNGTMRISGEFSFERTSTSGTLDSDDDEYNYTCNNSGTDFKRTGFTYSTQNAHLIDLTCPDYITSGSSFVTPNGKGNQTLDFGTGVCDANATLKASNGETKNISF